MDDLTGNENVNQQQGNDDLDEQGYLRPRAAVHDNGGAGGIVGANVGNANAGIGEMGKAFLSLAQQLSDLQRSNRYATGLNNLKVLKGTEGSEGIRRYFREFELMTCGWSEQERVEALNVKLEDRARLTLSSMPAHLQSVYNAVKAEILERLANDESKRVTKLSELMTGKLRKPSEPILDFGERVLKLVRDACDPSVPPRQVDEMAKAYFLTYVNDKDLIASLTEKQDSLEFRYLVDHAAALRANLDRFRRIASEASSNQSAQAVQQSSQIPSQQNNRSNLANRAPGSTQQQPRLNPYRTDLRYQGFPPAKGNFQSATPGQRPSNAAANVVQPSEGDVIDVSIAAQESPATPLNSEPDDSTSAAVAISGDSCMAQAIKLPASATKERLAYNTRCLLDVWRCLPFGQLQKFRPLSRYTSKLYASNKSSLPCRYTPEYGRTCDGWYTEDEEAVYEEKEARQRSYAPTLASSDSVADVRWYDYAPTLTSLDSVASSIAVGPNCTAIVRIRGIPCEALIDSDGAYATHGS